MINDADTRSISGASGAMAAHGDRRRGFGQCGNRHVNRVAVSMISVRTESIPLMPVPNECLAYRTVIHKTSARYRCSGSRPANAGRRKGKDRHGRDYIYSALHFPVSHCVEIPNDMGIEPLSILLFSKHIHELEIRRHFPTLDFHDPIAMTDNGGKRPTDVYFVEGRVEHLKDWKCLKP